MPYAAAIIIVSLVAFGGIALALGAGFVNRQFNGDEYWR